MFGRALAIMGWIACSAAAWAQANGPKDFAGRTELHAFQSLTLSDQQFLTGNRDGKPVTLTGQLRIAQGSGRLPLVILVHGSGGMGANIEAWARELNLIGISTFAIDGFTGRGLTAVSSNQALLGRLNFIVDIYQALEVVAKHPRVDAGRIALIGFSRGGQAALYASLARFHRLWNKSGAQFAAYVAFYPDCATTFVDDTDIGANKVRIFHGGADDYNPIATCKAYVGRLRAANRDVELTEYPGVHHSFDNPLGPVPPAASPASQSVRACTVREHEGGMLINVATKAPFSYKDECVALGPHTGADLAAAQAAMRAVTGFLRQEFKLE